ncbi:MAG: hypothetical protein JNJ76_08960 [Candidatus Competibacter sp.]|nr:hypothetical protein [Candidatus Competibacter sp.]
MADLAVTDRGALPAIRLVPGNADGREPLPELARGSTGKLIGDRGHISSQRFRVLWEWGLCVVTKIRENMHSKPMTTHPIDLHHRCGLYPAPQPRQYHSQRPGRLGGLYPSTL